MKSNLIFVTVISFFLFACKQDKSLEKKEIVSQEITDSCNVEEVSFSTQIQPLFYTNCNVSGCHSNNSSLPSFDNYNSIKSYIDNGLIDYWVFDSKLMPPSYAPDSTLLSDCELKTLTAWINQGSINN